MPRFKQMYIPHGKRWSQWTPAGRLTHVSCCDCGLVHTYEFRAGSDGYLYLRVAREEGATKRRRKQKKFPCVKLDKRRKSRE